MAKKIRVWSKEMIKFNPSDEIPLVAGTSTQLEMVNKGDCKVMFKLKATRPRSIHPDTTHGTINEKGGSVTVRISFKPKPEEGPFSSKDHLTILINPIAEGSKTTVDEYWKSPEAKNAHRFIINLSTK